MSSYIFDTSFLISLIHVDDINHEKSCALFGDLDANDHRFFISDLILSETYTVLAYKVDFSSVDILDRLLEKISIQYIGGNSEEYL